MSKEYPLYAVVLSVTPLNPGTRGFIGEIIEVRKEENEELYVCDPEYGKLFNFGEGLKLSWSFDATELQFLPTSLNPVKVPEFNDMGLDIRLPNDSTQLAVVSMVQSKANEDDIIVTLISNEEDACPSYCEKFTDLDEARKRLYEHVGFFVVEYGAVAYGQQL